MLDRHTCQICYPLEIKLLLLLLLSRFRMGDLGVHVSARSFFRLFVRPSVNIYPGCLVNATPLTVLY